MAEAFAADTVGSAFAAIAAGSIVPVGRFRYEAAEDRWWWSDELYRIYGYEPGDVVPTTEMLVSHLQPEDRHRAVERLVTVLAREKPVGTCFRITDAHRVAHTLVMVGTARHDPVGQLIRIDGDLIDVTRCLNGTV